MKAETTNRIPCLDGLRAISIALVVFSHFALYFGFHIENMGNLGVRIFFIISGFLITSILASEIEKTSTINLQKFYFRRILRIFPAYYFYIFVFLTAAVIGLYEISPSAFLSPLSFTSNYFISEAWELAHSWSLSVEEQFYLLFPGIFLALGLNNSRKMLLVVILTTPLIRFTNLILIQVSSGFDIPVWFIFGFHSNMDALAVGCLLALSRDFLNSNKFYKWFLQSSTGCFLLFAIIVLISVNSAYSFIFYSVGLSILNVSIAMSIDWVIRNHQNAFGKILNSSPFVFVGMMSYSIYLWQQPFSKYSEEKIWTHFPLNIILMMIFSLFSYYIIEKKFLQLRQNVEKRVLIRDRKEILKSTV